MYKAIAFADRKNFRTKFRKTRKIRKIRKIELQFFLIRRLSISPCMATSSSIIPKVSASAQEVITKIEDLIKTIVESFAKSGDCIIKTPTGNIRFRYQSSMTFGTAY
jgi:hypothetical protein